MRISFIKVNLNFIIFLTLLFSCGYSQLPEFVSEKIEVDINDGFYLITGEYFFHNPYSAPIKRSLFYPFKLDSNLIYPDSIKVLDQENTNIKFIKSKTGIYFSLEIPSYKTVKYEVFYSQSTNSNKAEYILTTTQKWGKALKKADFVIILPFEFKLQFLSYEFDTVEKTGGKIIYKIHKENFMPVKNLVVEWARKLK